jgi:hypothetical protein
VAAVVHQAVSLHLCRGEAGSSVDRHLREVELPCRTQPGMTDDDHALLVYDDGLPPPELFDRGCDFVYCSIGYEASIPGVSNRTIYGPRFDKHTRSQINVLASFGECALRSSSEPKLFLL